jgi:tRNA A37 methylthiotransferase MiaB
MKVIKINDVAYQVLYVYNYADKDNTEAHKRTSKYEVEIKNDKLQQLYFCDRIQDAEFSEITETKKLEAVDTYA